MTSRDEWSSYRAIAVACGSGASIDAIFEGTFVSNLWRGMAARLFFHRLSMTPAEQLFLLAFYRAQERERCRCGAVATGRHPESEPGKKEKTAHDAMNCAKDTRRPHTACYIRPTLRRTQKAHSFVTEHIQYHIFTLLRPFIQSPSICSAVLVRNSDQIDSVIPNDLFSVRFDPRSFIRYFALA